MNNNNTKRSFIRIALLLLAGALLPLSLAPWNWWPAGILSTAILAVLLRDSSPRQAYWSTAVFSFAMFAVGASWVYVSMNVYGNAPVLLSLLLTGLFVTALSLIFALPFLLFGAFCSHNRLAQLLGFPAVWVLGEWGLSWILTGFPWVYLGYGHLDSWLAGWAPVTGVWGISWIVAFCGATVALRIGRKRTPLQAGAMAAAVLLWLGGWGLQSVSWTTAADKPIRVGLLQPNIAQQLRWEPGQQSQIIQENLALNKLLWGNDLIIWPESAIPAYKHQIESLLQQLGDHAQTENSTLIVGLPVKDLIDRKYYNAVVAVGAGGGEYRKQHLVPFGEYVPMEDLLRGLIDFFNLPMSQFTAGTADQPLLATNGHTIATAICYEIAYPELVRTMAKDANMLLTVSNDTWFGDSLGPLQHLSMAQMRALENHKPLIRATNDGVTALTDHLGNLTDWLPQFTQGTLSGEITPRHGATPYSKTGSWPVLLICLIGLTLAWRANRR